MEPKNCKCECHAPKIITEVCPPHTFGMGYGTIEHGKVVMRTQVCKACGYRLDTHVS